MNILKTAFAAIVCGMVLAACNNDDDITGNNGTNQPDDTPKQCQQAIPCEIMTTSSSTMISFVFK